jgi:two-component system response regulator YesN
MWKVLLVEDEVFVRASVRQIIDWEEFGFTIIGEAGNGVEALELIKNCQPDLIICDIIMPLKNGVDLLKEAREAGSEARFVMLSCMSDFEYVQQAMQYGASNYVLKLSMSVKVIKDLLQKVDLELQQHQKQKLQPVSQELWDTYNHIWKSLFSQDEEPVLIDLNATPIQDFKGHFLTIFSILHGASNFNQMSFENLGLVEDPRRTILHLFTNSGQTTVFSWSPVPQKVLAGPAADYPYPIAFISVEAPDQLAEAWLAVIKKMDCFWYHYETGLVQSYIHDKFASSFQIPWEIIHGFLQDLDQNNTAKCQEIIGEIWATLQDNFLTMCLVKETAIQLDSLFCHMNQSRPGSSKDYRNCLTHQQLKELLLENITDYINKRNWEHQQITDHPEINKVISYISQTYYKEVTLSTLANYVGMDANYLSNLFKKKTGENIIHYIHRIRIDHAKNYLVHTGLPVNEIGEKVGFMNDNYFIKIFKRFTDLTPSHYRRAKK